MWKLALAMLALATATASAQTPWLTSETPNAPSASKQQGLRLQYSPDIARQKSTRELPDAPSYTPLSDKEKFNVFVETSASPLTFMSAGVSAGVRRAAGSQMYGPGSQGFSRMYKAALATQESNAFFGRFLFPKLLNQDPRYHPAPDHTGMMPRAFYAASRVLFTRKDDGQPTLNSSYLMSTVVSSSLANGYKPQYYRTFGNTSSDILSTIGSEAGMNVLREFWPQLRAGLTKMEPAQIKRLRDNIHEKFQ
jgi:hypothetical protein